MEYDRIDALEGIDTNETDGLCECIVCHYWYFPKITFRFQPKVYYGCHDMTQKCMIFDYFAIVAVGRSDCRVNFWLMTKSEAVDKMKNSDLSEEK